MQKENRQHVNCCRGFTLVELILVVGTIGLVSGALVGVVGKSYKDFKAGSDVSALFQDGQAAIEQITRILRQAKSITAKGRDIQQWGWIEFKDANDITMRIELQQTGELRYGRPGSLSTLIGNVTELYIVCDDIDGNVVANTTTGTPEADQSAASVRFVSLELGLQDNPQRFTGKVYLPIDHPIILPDIPQIGSPVAWYKLDGDGIANDNFALDWSGNDCHGTLEGGTVNPPNYTTGKFGKAIELDGYNDLVEYIIPGERTFQQFTVAVWARADIVGQAEWVGVFNSNAAGTNDFQIDLTGGNPGNYRYASSSKYQVIGPVTNVWVHLAVTCDGTNTKVYYNGTYIATFNDARTTFGRYAIGRNRGASVYFDGDIDDLRVYARELTAVEIADVVAGQAVDSPVVWWKFDNVVPDSSGNANHGTPEGPVVVTGKIDNAFSFDGVDDYVDCGKEPGSAEALTVAFWMKADAVRNAMPIDKHTWLGGYGWTVKLRNDGGLWWRIGSASNTRYSDVRINSVYEVGVWVYVACTFANGTSRVYVNGELRGTLNNIPHSVANTITALRMGVPSTVQPTEQFFGLLDDVRVYDVALSEAEIITIALEWKEGALD